MHEKSRNSDGNFEDRVEDPLYWILDETADIRAKNKQASYNIRGLSILQRSFAIFLFAIFTAVDFLLFICEQKDLFQTLFNRGNTARILASDHIDDLRRQPQFFLFYDLGIFYDIHGDIMIDEPYDIQIQRIDVTFHFEDILFTHFIAAGILDDRNGAVQFV